LHPLVAIGLRDSTLNELAVRRSDSNLISASCHGLIMQGYDNYASVTRTRKRERKSRNSSDIVGPKQRTYSRSLVVSSVIF
jgi:hypothetical protein